MMRKPEPTRGVSKKTRARGARWWPIAALSGLIAVVATWSIWQSGTTGDAARLKGGAGDAETEEWFASFLNGSKIGHARRSVRWITEDGRRLRQTDEFHSLSAMKATDRVESTITSSEITTEQGHLVRFRHEVRQSQQPLVVTGRVQGNVVDIEQTTLGASSSKRLRCSESIEGAQGLERNLSEPPITPGESRRFEAFTAGAIDIGQHSLRALNHEQTSLLGEPRKLLRVEWIASYPRGLAYRSTVWVDDQGRWQKQRNEDLGLETFRVTRQQALAPSNAGDLNLLFDTLIKVERPIRNPSTAKSIRYRVHLENGDPAELFAIGHSQSVKSLDSRTAQITVRSSDSGGLPAPADAPTDDDRKPSVMIQSQHPLIVTLAAQVAGDASDPAKLAKALARHVHTKMKRVDYTQAFATAAEVARDLKGDCSEHAVLLAALLRARQHPARVAIGLVYVEAAQAYGYHMWTESWTGDRWLPLDATTGNVAGATYLKIAATSLAAGLGDPSFLQVARLLGGKPKIEVLAVE